MTTPNWDQLPHYDVGGAKFLRLTDAFAEMKRTNSDYRVVCYEQAWDALDWSREPEESWDELCVQRAHQLRDRADWLRVWYSSGRDSHHMLSVFLNNNIHVDEIIVTHNVFDHEKSYDIQHIVLPAAHMLTKHLTTKVTEVKLTLNDWRQTFKSNWIEQGFGAPVGAWTFLPSGHGNLVRRRPDIFWRDHTPGIVCANVLGIDRPKLRIHDGWWHTYFQDSVFHMAMHDGCLDFFYFSNELPTLHAKQVWMAINHLEKMHADKSEEWLNKYTSSGKWGHGSAMYDDFCTAVGRGPAYHARTGLGLDKAVPGSARYQTMIKHGIDSKLTEFKQWRDGLAQLSEEYPDRFQQQSAFNGSVGILSKQYRVKPYINQQFSPT